MSRIITFCFLPIFILQLLVTPTYGQESLADAIDNLLTEEFKSMMKVDPEVRYKVLSKKFKDNLVSVLSLSENYDNPFTKLSEHINIQNSQDGMLRIFSWDEQGGGSSHIMAAYAQFKTPEGMVFVQELNNPKDDSSGTYLDVVYYNIYEIQIDDTTNYLTFGWGSHGGGHHFKTVNLYKIKNEELVKCDSCFEGKSQLEIVAVRMNEIKLEFNPSNKSLTFDSFEFNEETGFYSTKGEETVLRLVNGVFVE